MVDAVRLFRDMSLEVVREITFEVGMLGGSSRGCSSSASYMRDSRGSSREWI
jgi:hypothetical protein